MLQLKKDKAIAMQTAPVGGAATTAPEPEQSPVQQLGGANFDPNSVYDQTVKRASDVAGGLIKGGVADLIDLPVNMVNLGADALNSVGVENDFQMIPPTDISFLKKAKEMLTARQVPAGVSSAQDFARTGSEWFGLPLAKAKKAYDAGTSIAPNVISEVAPDVGAALGASAGEQIGQTLDMPWLEDVMGIVGGVTTGKAQNVSAPKRNKIDAKAIDVIQNNATANPMDLNQTIRDSVDNQTFGTLGDRANDGGVYAVERGLAKRPQSVINDKIAENDLLRGDEIINDVGSVIPTNPTAPFSDAASNRVEGLLGTGQDDQLGAIFDDRNRKIKDAKDALTEAEVTAAALRQTSPQLTDAPTTVNASRDLAGKYKQLAAEKKDLADKEWAVFDDSPEIDMSDIVKNHDLIWSDQNFASDDIALFKKDFKEEIARLKRMAKGKTDPRNVQSLLSRTKQKLSNRYETSSANVADGMMRDWVRVLEDTLTTSPTTANWKNAVAATKDLYDTTQPERFGKALKSPDVETLVQRMGLESDTGGSTARLIMESDDQRVIDSMDNAVRAKAKVQGLDGDFIKAHTGYLDERPELKAELQAQASATKKVADAETNATDVEQRAVARAKGLRKSVKKSTLAKYAGDAPELLKKILKTGDQASLTQLNQLVSEAKKTDTMDALRTQVSEQLSEVTFGRESKLKRATRGALGNFENAKQMLADSGVYTQQEVDRISKSLKRVKDLDNRKKSVTTAELDQTLSGLEEALASGVAVGALSLTPLSAGLVMTGVVRRGIKNWMLTNKNDPEILKRVEEFIINPDEYLKALDSGADPDALAQTLIQRITKTAPNVKLRQPITQDEDEE
jgi:hypothetical protein